MSPYLHPLHVLAFQSYVCIKKKKKAEVLSSEARTCIECLWKGHETMRTDDALPGERMYEKYTFLYILLQSFRKLLFACI